MSNLKRVVLLLILDFERGLYKFNPPPSFQDYDEEYMKYLWIQPSLCDNI